MRFNFVAPAVAVLIGMTAFDGFAVLGGNLAYQLDISRNKVPRMEGLHRLVDILADLGYDELQLYVEHTFAYSKHKTVWKGHSPVTAEEIRELDAHCARRGIDFVPNQNSFGHMHNWLRHPAYLPLAESPKGVRIEKPKIEMSFSALCATDPKSFEFLAGLYDELLPNFRSRYFNVGCDEVWDILDPRARSAAKVKEIGETGVYLNYLNELDRMVRARGRTMMYWADMALRHPETLDRLPKDAIALVWGYEKSHPFARQCAQIRGAGLPFSVCPSTSAWGSVFGRWSNARANIDAAFAAAGSYGARGVFVADWGDGGHPQPWIVSLPGVVYASAVRRGLHPDDRELAGMIDRVAGATCGEALLGIGNAYLNCCAEEGGNSHHLFKILRQGRRFVRPKDMTDDRLRATFDAIRAARAKAGLDTAPDWVKDDFATLDLLAELCELRAFGRFEESLSAEREARYRELWLRQNRPGGLDESVSQVFRR